jgi:hypothetical protein
MEAFGKRQMRVEDDAPVTGKGRYSKVVAGFARQRAG